jgi:hypothetical protein
VQLRADLTRRHEPLNLSLSSALKKAQVRRGTRISCEIPITLTSLEPVHPSSEPCLTLLVNHRAQRRSAVWSSAGIGAVIQLEGLPARTSVTARVVNCILIGEYEKFWLLGLALD